MPRTTSDQPVPDKPRRKRSLRCLRCNIRKFRTPRDLALHILSKHGHVHVPVCDDARSITQTSPILTTDLAELDLLLAAAPTLCGPLRKRKPIAKRPRRDSFSTSTSSSASSRDESYSRLPALQGSVVASVSEESEDGGEEEGKRAPIEGESTGPRAIDVCVRQYRSGRLPVVPIQPCDPAMLNFAAGLF